MTAMLVAEFRDPETMLRTARRAKALGHQLIDAFTPFPIEGMPELLDATSTRLRVVMFFGGMAFAATAYGIEVWSAIFNYPINSGGRPLNSWPVFMFFPFAIGIFGAAFFGMIGLLVQCGLPSLYHPLFDIEGFERATQDRFMLTVKAPDGENDKLEAARWLRQAGAGTVWELEP